MDLLYPKVTMTPAKALQMAIDGETYLCIVCCFVGDEAAGRPEDGIAAGTRWAGAPESWACHHCGVAKADVEVVES